MCSRTLFLHAGLQPDLRHLDEYQSVSAANAFARNLIASQPRHPMFTSHMSPLSTRELALADSTALCDVILPRALTHFRVLITSSLAIRPNPISALRWQVLLVL